MIGHLQGKILYFNNEDREAIIDTAGGVGYLIRTTSSYKLGDHVEVFIHYSQSDHGVVLYAFPDILTWVFFRKATRKAKLKTALVFKLLGNKNLAEITMAAKNKQPAIIVSEGIGGKTAQSIINALVTNGLVENDSNVDNNVRAEVSEYLLALGFTPKEVNDYFQQIEDDVANNVQSIIANFLSKYERAN